MMTMAGDGVVSDGVISDGVISDGVISDGLSRPYNLPEVFVIADFFLWRQGNPAAVAR